MSIVAIGMGPGDGRHILPAARAALAEADILAGAEGHLAALRLSHPGKSFLPWDGDLGDFLDHVIEAAKGSKLALLVSGDPCLFSMTAALGRRLGPRGFEILPGLSSFQYLCAKVGLSWEGARFASVHGRSLAALDGLDPEGMAIVFTDARNDPAAVAARLLAEFGAERPAFVGIDLGYEGESILESDLGMVAEKKFAGLCTLVIPARVARRAGRGIEASRAASRLLSSRGGRKAIILAGFGSSHRESLGASMGAIESLVAERFPDVAIRRAFSSSMVIKIWRDRGLPIEALPEALGGLQGEGFDEVLVQPLHIIPGEEYHKLIRQAEPFRGKFHSLRFGAPLFAEQESYRPVLDGIVDSLPPLREGEAVLFMGHGSRHPANAAYALIQMMLDEGELPLYVATIEGYPDLGRVLPRLLRRGVRRVYLVPLMLVAGDHARNDMAGDGEDSWKGILEARGIDAVPLLRGLGEIPAIQEFFVGRVRQALAETGYEGAAKGSIA